MKKRRWENFQFTVECELDKDEQDYLKRSADISKDGCCPYFICQLSREGACKAADICAKSCRAYSENNK